MLFDDGRGGDVVVVVKDVLFSGVEHAAVVDAAVAEEEDEKALPIVVRLQHTRC